MKDDELKRILKERFQSLGRDEVQVKAEWKWPDDDDGRVRCIMLLFNMCHMPFRSRETRLWAYAKLEEIARELFEPFDRTGKPHQSPLACKTIQWWCHAVVSGTVPDPKHEPGNSRISHLWRDLEIVNSVQMVRNKTGRTREEAIKFVSELTEVSLSPGRTKKIVDQAGPWPFFEKILRNTGRVTQSPK